MRRVVEITRDHARGAAVDHVMLDSDDRRRRRIVLTGEKGTTFLLDLPQPVTLRDGDGLVLDDGSAVLVAGKPEPLLEVSAASDVELVRIAWHIGNRHAEVQFIGNKLRIRRDHVLEEMVTQLGGTLHPLEAAFDPGMSEHRHRGHGHAHDGHDHEHGLGDEHAHRHG